MLQKTSHGYGTIAGPGGVDKGAIVVRVPQKAFMSAEVILCSHGDGKAMRGSGTSHSETQTE